MSRKSTTIPREELQPGDTVWTTQSGVTPMAIVATVEHKGWMSEATFKPASNDYLGPQPPTWKNFYGGTVQVMREAR